MFKEITSSKSYRNAYNSFDTSASVSGGFKGFSASASAAYGEVNSMITSSQEDHHIERGHMTTYNSLDYQIQREVSTRIEIDGKTALYVEKRYVDSTDREDKWTQDQKEARSERYLKRRFYGEDDKISGSTYKIETCVKETCKNKCQKCKKLCQLCSAAPGFSAHLCDRKCSLAYAGNGLRQKSAGQIGAKAFLETMCYLFYPAIGTPKLTSNTMSTILEAIQKLKEKGWI